MIDTIKGWLDEATLRRVELSSEDDDKRVDAVEWWEGDQIVRRDVHVTMKRFPPAQAEGGFLGE